MLDNMKKSEKITYEIDPHNRLVLKALSIPKYRMVLDGRFSIDNKNTLTYHVKHPQGSGAPQQLKLSGDYSLDKNHNLVFTLDKWNKQNEGDKLSIKGELLDAAYNGLAFSVATKDINGKTSIYALKLTGKWRANKHNQLIFEATKEKDTADAITLTGGWKVNRKNEIVYSYSRYQLKTNQKTTKTLSVRGFWDIRSLYRLSYVLNKELNSRFDFKIGLGKLTKNGLEYQIGVGAIPKTKRFTIFGEWKISKRLGLMFEVPYENRAPRQISIGAAYKLKHGEAFLKALKSGKEIILTAGIGLLW